MTDKKSILTIILAFIAGIGTTITPMVTNYYEHKSRERVLSVQTQEMRQKYKMIGELQRQMSILSLAHDAMRRENEKLNTIVQLQINEIKALKNRLIRYENK